MIKIGDYVMSDKYEDIKGLIGKVKDTYYEYDEDEFLEDKVLVVDYDEDGEYHLYDYQCRKVEVY